MLSKKKSGKFYVLSIIIAMSIFRIFIYGDPRLSIATNDTQSYVKSSQVPLFSSEIMTGRRPLSTNLIYKLLEPKKGYHVLANGSIDTTRRVFQPGFERIALLQLICSIVGWGFLAFTITEFLANPFTKILSAVTILLFAFTPQIADWDSILMSESLTFSLFALQMAFLIKIISNILSESKKGQSFYLAAWSVIFFLWTFLRDTNLFVSMATIGMFAITLTFIQYRTNKVLQRILAFVFAMLLLGLITSSKSTRAQVQMVNIFNDDLLHNPASISTLSKLGMPHPYTKEYNQWFKKNATSTLVKYMFIHPGYPLFKIIRDFPKSFAASPQNYFKAPEQAATRGILITTGNTLHPENTATFLLDLFLLFGVISVGLKHPNIIMRRLWAWLSCWLFLVASCTLIPSILGDTWALPRHALFSTTIYRLFMWLFIFVIMDVAIENNPHSETQASIK